MHIIGTAGHVDHGKSSLVIALTGHDPDRLIEERRRGMTLDLGFAPLRFPDGVSAGIIDVPGHERFLHNMLAGAAGMELLLLVIAATEGPKPQTHEHLHILNYLNVTRAIVVLTKIDLASPDEQRRAADLASAACANTIAADAPVIEVSTLTGEGIDALKSAVHEALVGLPPRRANAPAFLPVDRVFALPGHGTIVTGTLMQGTVTVGDTLALAPSGLAARVKSLQVFGEKVQSAAGGSRVAVNLPGVPVDQIARGEALVAPREFTATREIEVDFSALPAALQLLRKSTAVRVHAGSAEIPAQLRFAEAVPASAAPARARLNLWRPTVVYPGMRIVIRRMSPKDLLGGASVRAAGASASQSTPAPGEFDGAPEWTAELAAALESSGLTPVDAAKLAARANVTVAASAPALAWLAEHGRAVQLQKPAEYVAQTAMAKALDRVSAELRRRHQAAPWRVGMRSADVAATLSVPEKLAARLLAAWQDDGRVAARAGFWHAPDFTPALTGAQRTFFSAALARDTSSPFAPHSFEELAQAAARHSPSTGEALDMLLATGALVRVGDDVYRRSQVEGAQAAIRALLGEHGQATMAQLRDVLGTSRKHALPLMEYFDSAGFTIRVGDVRRLRTTTPKHATSGSV